MVKEINRNYISDMPFRMSEEQKAKAFLRNTNMPRSEISRKTGISRRQLTTYSTNQSALANAKHIAVVRLAQLYDADYVLNVGGNQLNQTSVFRKAFVEAQIGFIRQLSTLRIPDSEDSYFTQGKDKQNVLKLTDYYLASSSHKLLEEALKDIVLQDTTRNFSTDVSLAYLYQKAIDRGWSAQEYNHIYKDKNLKEFKPILEGYDLLRVDRDKYEEQAKNIAEQAKSMIIAYQNFIGNVYADNDQELVYQKIKDYCNHYSTLIDYSLSSKVRVQIDPIIDKEYWFDGDGNSLDLTADERMDSFSIIIFLSGDAITQLEEHDRLPKQYSYIVIPIYSDYADLMITNFISKIGRLCGFNL